jgi:hypothetical protein
MRALVAALVLLPCAAFAAPEAYPISLIDRPLILPAGKIEFGLLGNLSNWSESDTSITGEAGVAGVEFGFGGGQLGVALALPLNPGFAFGSIAGSAAFAISAQSALRLDFAYDRVGFNGGDNLSTTGSSTNLLSGGLGVPFQVRLAPNLSLVSGRIGAMNFAHFTNVGANGVAIYAGAGDVPFSAADLVVITGSTESGGGSRLAINVPLGLLIQVAPPFSITLRAGYEGFFALSGGGSTEHFLPLGVDAVFATPGGADVGASFSLAGSLNSATATFAGNVPGYLDIQMFTLWLRFRT